MTKTGHKYELVDPGLISPNDWNPNRQSDEMYQHELVSIKRFGFSVPIIVRLNEAGQREIVDGEHRWKAAQELGIKPIPCYNLGPVSRETAIELTVALNEIRGVADPLALGDIFRELAETVDLEELTGLLPFTRAEIDRLIKTTEIAPYMRENLDDLKMPAFNPRAAYTCALSPQQLELVLLASEKVLNTRPLTDEDRGDAIARLAEAYLS